MDNININKSKAHVVGNISNNNLLQSNEKKNNDGENNLIESHNSLNKSNKNNMSKDFNMSKNINTNMVSGDINDSFGDKILQNLNKYRKMALGESSVSQSMFGNK